MPKAYQRRWLPIITILIGLVLLVVGDAQAQPTPPPFDPDAVPVPDEPPAAFRAATSYAENCAPCHGATGNSDGPTVADLPVPPPAFADPATTWAVAPAEYFHTTKFGRMANLMPPWRNQLTDDEIWQVVAYARSLHTTEEAVADGATRYAAQCAACHGEDGRGDGPDADGTLGDLSDQATMMRVSDADLSQGWNSAHAEIGADWSSEERRNTLDYIRTFTYTPPWALPYAAGTGIIQGYVVQGTPDGGTPADLPVTLFGFLDFTQVMSATTTSEADGSFQFDDLSSDPEVAYVVETDYADIGYTSDFLRFNPDAPIETVEVRVYEPSDDDSNIVINRSNWIIDHQPGALRAGQIIIYGNPGDQAFAGTVIDGAERPVTVAVPVPANAENIDFPDGELGGRFLRVGDVIYDTAPLPPGDEVRQIFISYDLPYDDADASLALRWPYAVERLNLLVAELPDLAVEAEGLSYASNDTLEGTEFEVWNGENLAAESIVTANFAGLLPAGSMDPRLLTETDDATLAGANMPAVTVPPLEPWVPWAFGALALLALGAIFVMQVSKAEDAVTVLTRERDALVKEIAALDDTHAQGEIDDPTWSAQRAQLKRELVETTLELTRLQEAGK